MGCRSGAVRRLRCRSTTSAYILPYTLTPTVRVFLSPIKSLSRRELTASAHRNCHSDGGRSCRARDVPVEDICLYPVADPPGLGQPPRTRISPVRGRRGRCRNVLQGGPSGGCRVRSGGACLSVERTLQRKSLYRTIGMAIALFMAILRKPESHNIARFINISPLTINTETSIKIERARVS